MMAKNESKGSAGDHLANERTFLAWTRTSIGIMAFGFVVVKFSLFLKQISIILGKGAVDQSKGYSSVAGIVLVIVGAIAAVLSYIRYKKTEKQLETGYYKHSSVLMTILTAFIFGVSVFLIIYLIKSI
jgi:putative membrane protein